VTGPGPALVIVDIGPGGSSEYHNVMLPWTLTSGKKPSFVELTAASESDVGPITCTIATKGATSVSQTSTGAYVIASCFSS
jgi:hypothetical protein